jgi:hypothetical protein
MRPKELCSRAKKGFIPLLVGLVATTAAWATHENILHNFVASPHGANPLASLIADAAGNLYSTTANGGRYGYGTVFELTPGESGKWVQIVLYSFTGGSDGANPVAGLIFDAMGNLYGTTAAGGTRKRNVTTLIRRVVVVWFSNSAPVRMGVGPRACSTGSMALLTMARHRQRVRSSIVQDTSTVLPRVVALTERARCSN